jgi:hypothetical protein
VSDYSEAGAQPVEDAAVDDPPTVDEVLEHQRTEHPEQVPTSTQQPPQVRSEADEVAAALDAGGEPTGEVSGGEPDVAGPNSA